MIFTLFDKDAFCTVFQPFYVLVLCDFAAPLGMSLDLSAVAARIVA